MEGSPDAIDPKNLVVKALTPSDRKDLDDLEELELLTFGRAAQNVWGLVPMMAHGRVLLARYDSEPVAWTVLWPDWSAKTTAYVWSYAVVQKHHKRGLGAALLADVIARLPAEGYTRLEAVISPANLPALGLARKFAFERAAVLPGWYGETEDRWLMVRAL
jgi:L-amino acid N-acyltransferase YncA